MLVRGLLRSDTSQFAKLNTARAKTAGLLKETKIEDAPVDALSQTDWFLLAIDDDIRRLIHVFHTVYRKEGTRPPPPPDLIPRPGMQPKRRKTLSAWFGAVGLGPASKTSPEARVSTA